MSGSIVSAWIDGVTYNVKSDADLDFGPDVELEGIRHSGGTLPKKTLVAATITGIDLIVDGTEEKTLREVAKSKGPYPLGCEEEDGTIRDGTGWLNITTTTSAERTMNVEFVPDGEWEITAA